MSTLSYQYVARDRTGSKRTGTTMASSQAEAFKKLMASGLVPTSLRVARPGLFGVRRVKPKEIANFTQQLAVLVGARISISDGLRSIVEQEPAGRMRDIIARIASRIEAGDSVSLSIGEHRDAFGEVYIATIRAAEQSGNLVKSLDYLADMFERGEETRSQVKSALMYPAIICSVMVIALAFLLGFVIPKFSKMFASKGADLPLLTKIMMDVGNSVANFWWLYLVIAVVAVVGSRAALRSSRGRALIQRTLCRVPLLRQIIVGLAVSRFARVFGLCLSSGINLLDAIELSATAAGNAVLSADCTKMAQQVRMGGRIADSLDNCKFIPPFARRMLAAGDEAAEMPRMCGIVARQYEREATALTKQLATIVEPVLVVLIAAIVLLVALAVFLPMWNSVGLVG